MTRISSPQLLFAFVNLCTFRYAERGETLFDQDQLPNGLHILISAKARLMKRSLAGDFVIQPDIESGALGISDLLAKRPHPVTAVIVERGEVGFIPLDALTSLMENRADSLADAIRNNLEARVQLTDLLADAISAVFELAESRAIRPIKTA